MSLKTDKLQLDIVINSDESRKKIQDLELECNDFARQMRALIAENGKAAKDSVEYLKLLDKFNINKDKIKDLRNEIGITGSTIKELLQRQGELNASMKGMDPRLPKFQELKNQLLEVRDRLKELRGTAKETETVFSHFKNSFMEGIGIGTGIGAVQMAFGAVVGFFKEGIGKAIEYEERIEKLKFALNGNNDALKNMTRYADQMSKTTLFKKSDILDAATLGIEFGRTEEQTKKMMTAAMGLSRVTGMELKDAMVALNGTYAGTTKGIEKLVPNIKGLTKEQYANGVAIDIITDKMGRFATSGLESTEGKMTQFEKSMNSIKVTLGNFALDVIGPIVNGFAELTQSISQALKAKDLTAEFHDQAAKVVDLQTKISPLLDKYDALKTKTSLSADEQKELKSIIEKVTSVLPGATSEFDKYGNAIAISTKRAREAIETEIDKMNILNKDAITQRKKELEIMELDLKVSQDKMNQITKSGTFKIDEIISLGRNQTIHHTRSANEKEIEDAVEYNKALLSKKRGTQAALDDLNGNAIKNEQKRRDDDARKATKAEEDRNRELIALRRKSLPELQELLQVSTDANEKVLLNKVIAEKKADDKILKAKEDFNKAMIKLRNDQIKDDEEKELAATDEKYREIINKAKKNKENTMELEDMWGNERIAIGNKYFQKRQEEQNKIDTDNKKEEERINKEEIASRIKNIQDNYDDLVIDKNKKFLDKMKTVKGQHDAEKKLQEEFNKDMRALELSNLLMQEAAVKQASKDKIITKAQEVEMLRPISNKMVQLGMTEIKIDEKKQDTLRALAEASAITAAKNVESALLGATSMEDAGKRTLQAIRQEIKALLAKAIALEIVKDLAITGPFGAAVAGVAAAGLVALFDTMLPQFGAGNVDVIGASDGRRYNAARGGMITQPTIINRPTLIRSANGRDVLTAEAGLPEMIIDGPRTRNIMMNYPEIYDAIRSVSQYGNGNVGASSGGGMFTDPEMLAAIKMLNQHLASTNFLVFDRQYKRFQAKVNNIESNFGTKVN